MSFDNRARGWMRDAELLGPVDLPRTKSPGIPPQAVRWLPVVANNQVWCMDELNESLATACVALGSRPLLVDGASSSPAAPASAALDLASGIRVLSRGIHYLPAGGLLHRYVDAQGSAGRFLDELLRAAPDVDTILVHADASDMARLFRHRPHVPLLLTVDEPESLKEAYTNWKWLNLRCAWSQARLLVAKTSAERGEQMARTLSSCAAQFMDATLLDHAVVGSDAPDLSAPNEALLSLVATHLKLQRPPGQQETLPPQGFQRWVRSFDDRADVGPT
jgi:hypothetical protein